LTSGIARGRVPKDWLHVDGYTNGHNVFRLDLCTECKKVIIKFTENA
jgi:hypothetical protein